MHRLIEPDCVTLCLKCMTRWSGIISYCEKCNHKNKDLLEHFVYLGDVESAVEYFKSEVSEKVKSERPEISCWAQAMKHGGRENYKFSEEEIIALIDKVFLNEESKGAEK